MKSKFKEELTQVLNKHSMENGSNTPDFILAQYLLNCLAAFNSAVNRREDWYGRKGFSTEDAQKLIGLFTPLKPEPCPNRKETVEICACMRNKCIKCGEPVGNVTFTVCDSCWKQVTIEEKVKKIEAAFDTVLYKLSTEHYFIRNDKENRNRLQSYIQMLLNQINFDYFFGDCYQIKSDDETNTYEVIDNKQIVAMIYYFDDGIIRINKKIVLDLYTPKEFLNKVDKPYIS